MPVETDIDRSIMLVDFGVACSYTPVGGDAKTITVILDNEYFAADGSGSSVAFAMRQPKVLCRTADLTGVAENGLMTIEGDDFTIRVVMPDGTGMTELMLEEA